MLDAPTRPRSAMPILSLLIVLLAAFLPLVMPDGAGASLVDLQGKTITIAGTDQQERLLLRQRDSALRIDERNPNRTLTTTSPACTPSGIAGGRSRLECDLAGVKRVKIATAGGNDRIGVGTTLPSRGDRAFCRAASLDPKLRVTTGRGRDVAELSNGPDRARGGTGSDLLLGCGGDDSLGGGGSGDRLSGDRGSDELSGGGGGDDIVGCQFDPDDVNYPRGEPGADLLRGGAGSDFLYGCGGRDRYRAGSGPDNLNTRDRKAEPVGCSTGKDLVYADGVDRLRGCERTTECTTDNFPFPCSARATVAAGAPRFLAATLDLLGDHRD